MKWITVKDKKPTGDAVLCYVMNDKKFGTYLALYYSSYDYFVLYNPEIRDHAPIEVTHWIPLPEWQPSGD